MDKNEKIAHLRQLSKTVDSLIEAIENSNPVDDTIRSKWNVEFSWDAINRTYEVY